MALAQLRFFTVRTVHELLLEDDLRAGDDLLQGLALVAGAPLEGLQMLQIALVARRVPLSLAEADEIQVDVEAVRTALALRPSVDAPARGGQPGREHPRSPCVAAPIGNAESVSSRSGCAKSGAGAPAKRAERWGSGDRRFNWRHFQLIVCSRCSARR